jgi:hypothetical protein
MKRRPPPAAAASRHQPLTRRQLVAGCGALAAGAWLGGCGGGGGNGSATSSAATNPQPTPAGSLTSATLSVSALSLGSIGPAFAGLSYEKSSLALPRFTPGNADLIGMFQGLGESLLRIGGNSVDKTQWTPAGPGRTAGEVAPADIDALGGFLRGCGWNVLYGVNLATSTPAAAAAEVSYAAHSLGASLYGIEIGNEPDLYGGNYFQSWTLQDFELRWQAFRTAILGSTPHVVLTGPADATNIGSWTIPFGEYAGSAQIALLTQHYYRGNGQSPSSTDAELISPDPTLKSDLAELHQGSLAIGVPFRMAETNSFYNGGADGVSDSYASALWVIDHLFSIALGGGVGANLHGGGDGDGYTPIADSNGTVVQARPEYYGTLLFTLAGEGTLLAVSLSAGGLDVTAYALEASAGALSIVVVNKDATHNLALDIDCGRAVAAASLLAMTGPALAATSGVQIQGTAVAVDGSFAPQPPYQLPVAGSQVSCYVASLSAVLIRVS